MSIEILETPIRYAAKTKIKDLALEVAQTKNLGKVRDKISLGADIFKWCQALDYGDYLSQNTKDRIIRALVDLAGINDLPVAPYLGNIDPPTIGAGNTTNVTNITSSDVTDWSNLDVDTGIEVLDSFAITAARGAVWFYTIRKSTNQRSGQVVGSWLSDGTVVYSEDSTEDMGDTSGVTLTVDYSSPNIRLKATVTSDDWIVEGSRLLING